MSEHSGGRDDMRRPDLRAALERDLRRYSSREPGNRTFWASLSVLGSVGWPLVFTSVGGALAGRYLDALWGTGIRMTLTLLVAGTIAGAVIVHHLIQPRP